MIILIIVQSHIPKHHKVSQLNYISANIMSTQIFHLNKYDPNDH